MSLSVQGNVGGSVEGSGQFEDQTEVTIRASAAEGYKFVDWQAEGVTFSSKSEDTFTIAADTESLASFKPAWQLTLETDPEGGGTVSGAGVHIENFPATIVAIPNEGYRFIKWKLGEQDYSPNAIDSVVSDTDLALTAFFEKIQWGLTTSADNGKIVLSPDLDTYEDNSTVTLTAMPDSGLRFVSWNGDTTGDALSKELLMNGDKTVTANFVLDVPDTYYQWLNSNAPGEPDLSRIQSKGDLDFDGLPNYLEFVLGTTLEPGVQTENPELLFQETGQANYCFYAQGPLQGGRLFVGISSDFKNWQWVEFFYGSNIWVSSNPGIMRILETQQTGGSNSPWKITLELVEKI